MADTRRPQIVEAAQRVIARHGLADTTMARIATEAGVQTSLVSHYFGSKRAVLLATVEHVIEGYEGMLDEALAGVPDDQRLDELLEVSFGGHLLHRLYGKIIDEVRAAANFDPEVRTALRGMSEVFHQNFVEAILDAHPDADPEHVSRIAYGIVCIFQTAESLERQGFERHHVPEGRAMAQALLATLTESSGAGADAPPEAGAA